MATQTWRFNAKHSDGRMITLEVNRTESVHQIPTFEGVTQMNTGRIELRTITGLFVNRKEKGLYDIAETGDLIRSDSPDAP